MRIFISLDSLKQNNKKIKGHYEFNVFFLFFFLAAACVDQE